MFALLAHWVKPLAKTLALSPHGFNPVDWVILVLMVICLMVWVKKGRKTVLTAIQAEHPEVTKVMFVEHNEFTGFPELATVRNQDGSEAKYKFESAGKWALSK